MIWNVIVCLVVILFIVYIILNNKESKRGSRKTVPGPKPSSVENGNLEEIRSAGSLHEYLRELHSRWGPIASFWLGKQQVVSIASVQLFKQHQKHFDRPVALFEMMTDLIGTQSIQLKNGEEGKKLHKALSRPFAFSECKKYYGTFSEIGKQLLDKLEALPPSTHVPIWENMTIVALKGLLQTAFGHQLVNDKVALDINRNYETAWHKIESFFNKSDPAKLNDEEIKNAIKWYRKFALDLLESRQPGEEELFVDVLLNYDENEDHRVDNAVTFITGGFHTTSCLLTWALYFLAQNQDIQDKVAAEINQILGGEEVTPDNFRNLKYLQNVLDETLRFSTLAPYAARCSENDTELGDFLITAKTPVLHALGVVLNDGNIWESPEIFNPERFSPECIRNRSSLAFSPFGFAGQRICPGYRFAAVEATIVLSAILPRLKFKLVEGQDVHSVFGLVTKPSSEIWMTVEPRNFFEE